ncbi:hypothetical protein D6C86_05220 [Aureobasidium pullulans]|uniref:F-box domain-containing protein n=1 Tax=Aureobasidium pullulans TaxID=5580 RepID=A0A4V4KPB1_AURPU|nr:hypothetical protein D6C94_03162 [Aureobasidium pullulans]THZ37711.1 hypothetical protein D6C87_08296 [Aureobasidium pullulans]THZ60257.1 hypothetical protein D6C86_05220 [Aureobasidium pullulans]
MVHILPDVLSTIFSLVREEQSLHALSELSTVCRLWRDIAQPVLWSHLVLTADGLQLLVENVGRASDKLKMVRSVTLHIEVITSTSVTTLRSQYDPDMWESDRLYGFPQTRALQQIIDRFTITILPKLVSLASFSVFVTSPSASEDDHTPNSIGFRLQTEVLGRLLRALPASCESLELDTGGTDWSPGRVSHHLCPDIWYIMPRLRHVKLRVHNLCSRILLLSSVDSNDRHDEPDLARLDPSEAGNLLHADLLSTLSICILSRVDAGCTFSLCPDLQANLDLGQQQPWLIGGGGGYDTKPLSLTSNLALAYKSGCFPAAHKIEVVQDQLSFMSDMEEFQDDMFSMTDQERQRAELYGYSVLIRDCIEDKTYPLPMRYIGDGCHGLYDKSDNCVIGKEEDCIRYAEHTVWDETVYGARLPFGAGIALAGATPKPPPMLLTRKEWRQRSKKGMLSWRKEEGRTGVKIKRVVPLDGVDVKFDYTMMPLLPARGERIPGDDRID